MQIVVEFKFNHEDIPVAVTGVEGAVADILLPTVGDLVRHKDIAGRSFEGRVTNRIFEYELAVGTAVQGAITVTLCLDRTVIQ